MATAARSQPPKTKRAAGSGVVGLLASDTLRTWIVPGTLGVVLGGAALLSGFGLVSTPPALATGLLAALGLMLWVGVQPLVTKDAPRAEQLLGLAFTVVWIAALYFPFHVRLFPGQPLLDHAELNRAGDGLPVHIPAAGHARIDLEVEGQLLRAPGGADIPVTYSLTLAGADGAHIVTGRFDETLTARRLGRRGTTTVRHPHEVDLHILANPGSGDLDLKGVTLAPDNAPPIHVSVFAHPLPGSMGLSFAALGLLSLALAFDRRPVVETTEGAVTLATAGALGTTLIFWTSNAAHPDFSTLVGAAILGGGPGYVVGWLLWKVATRIIGRRQP